MEDFYKVQPNIFKGALKDALDNCRRKVPSSVFGLPENGKCQAVSLLGGRVLYVVKDFLEAQRAVKAIEGFSLKKVSAIYEREEVLLTSRAFSKETEYKRIKSVYDFLNKKTDIAVITLPALLQKFPKTLNALTLEKGKEYDILALSEKLTAMGYTRGDSVSGKGSFARRGDILDIYAIDSDSPVRLDFFGDELESIKYFDPDGGKTLSAAGFVEILPCTEIVLPENTDKIIGKIDEELRKFTGKDNLRFKEFSDDVKTSLSLKAYSSLTSLIPVLDNTGNAFEAFDFDSVVFSEPKQLYALAEAVIKEHGERFKSLYGAGEVFSFDYFQNIGLEELEAGLKTKSLMAFSTLVADNGFFTAAKLFNVRATPAPRLMGRTADLINEIAIRLNSGYKVFVSIAENDYERISLILAESGYDNGVKNLNVFEGRIVSGVIYQDEKICIIGNTDIVPEREKRLTARSKNKVFFSAPEAGDYAVHEIHGIGKVIGTKRLETSFGKKDYIAVAYRGGDILYVPVEQLNVLTKYVGAEKEPTLSKIGGKDFERIKERVKSSLRELTVNLKKLYSDRQKRIGYVFEEDEGAQKAFELACGFEDTPDQITATEDVKKDMTSSKVMDRLICGDVGFGKTEIAFRAIFRAVNNGKQAVLLAPTTILAEQHYNNALERFKGFGVKIESLDRFKSAKEQQKVLSKLRRGEIDFIIGTHRLLSKDVEFCDLGLLVLDEEQRFGVEHKEKIKTLKSNVDTLTLTATPIPRTLHMSLSGIRDISTINTPPKERLPIQTYVTEETETLIRDAVSRELGRGGQVFILYNRVESIYTFNEKLKTLVPEAKITVCHGQMEEKELETGISDFYKGRSDVLLATTIIENGLDLPKANTIIVIDADKLGLSTLYQLRGRVGRSNRLAHAYFTYKKDKVLSDTAYKRLSAIMEFTEMGSGFKIAMRDLEIRGAGNILGAEQHGHMDKIGYELYSKLLKEEMDGGTEEIIVDTDVRISAYIPDEYIESSSGRMDAYKDIAETETAEDGKKLYENLSSAYGKPPVEIKNLIYVAILKAAVGRIGGNSLTIGDFGAAFGFENLKKAQDPALFKIIAGFPDASLSAVSGIAVKFSRGRRSDTELLKDFAAFVLAIEKEKNKHILKSKVKEPNA